jgi:trimeric autotransporter adhesin
MTISKKHLQIGLILLIVALCCAQTGNTGAMLGLSQTFTGNNTFTGAVSLGTTTITNLVSCAGAGCSTGGGGGGSITGVTAGTGLTGGGTSGAVTLNIGATGVSANSYICPASITVNAQGQITAITAGSCSGGGGGGTGTQNQTAYYSALNTLGAFGPGITGQGLVSQGSSSAPIMASPGLTGRVKTSGSTDAILCDSSTTTRDRLTTIIYATGSTVTVTVPDAGSTGCSGGFSFVIALASFNGATASTTVTVNNTTSSTFNTLTGSASTGSLTTFSLTTGKFAMFSSPDNANWLVRID